MNEYFFASVRNSLFKGAFEQLQVDGLNTLLQATEGLPIEWRAYMLATAYHETAYTMQPVREAFWMSEEWRKQNLRYWPWYGRGYVQLTWEVNYRRLANDLGIPDLATNPDIALVPDIAAKIMRFGMINGRFTGKKLSDYLNTRKDYVGARRIINGTDKALLIADYAEKFEVALRLIQGETPVDQTRPDVRPFNLFQFIADLISQLFRRK